ncbi:hypothetical protein BTUL_0017g00940 [Botrytis tulipae]|uniref:NmrA-like domain-containing protein n=1 Tax=Botrytis tulipae TaxID=87230 RepID=A0A4Z1F3Z3_9HELO|nr:hypothetical protein BTUL_0017g00940 [Botrytis tulipae]
MAVARGIPQWVRAPYELAFPVFLYWFLFIICNAWVFDQDRETKSLQTANIASMASTSVLLFGATGYIGAAFLSRFSNKYLMSPSPRYKLTASIRSPEKARRLRDLLGNIETTDVTFNDGVKLEREVEKHVIIIQLADCDALEGTKSILKGMKTRKEKTRYPPILYHAVDRVVDHSIVKADEAGDLLSFIIVPFAVYGTATGLIHKHKLGNQTSMPVPLLIHVSVDRRAVGQIGPGENPWMISHVNDGWSPELNPILGNDFGRVLLTILLVADLFMALLEDTTKGHGKDGFYFADGGYVLARDIFRVMAETLYSIGLSEEPSPNTYTEEELDKYKIGFWGASIQATGDRAKSTGWNPQHTVGEFQGYVVTETKRLAFQPLQSYGRCLDYSDENTYTSSSQQ